MKIHVYNSPENELRKSEQPPNLPSRIDFAFGYIYYQAINDYQATLSRTKKESVLFEDQKLLQKLLLVPILKPDTFYSFDFDGKVEVVTTMSDGWIPSYNNPDNSGCEQPAEPIDLAYLIPVKQEESQDLERMAEDYADSRERRGTSYWQGLKIGYMAGHIKATSL